MLIKNKDTLLFCKIIIFFCICSIPLCTYTKKNLIGSEWVTLGKPFFVVIVPSYNNSKFYKKNIDSILQQDYPFFHVIYTDDASPDKTADLVEKYIRKHNAQDKVTLIRNKKRTRAAPSRYKMVHMCHPKVIIANMDGDDWFKHSQVLSKLAKIYLDPNVWMTYGRWKEFPSGKIYGAMQAIPQQVIDQNSFRKHSFMYSPLRTFYAKLFQMIQKEDFLYDGTNFFPVATDQAFSYPMQEMAGNRSKYVPEVFYIYNKTRRADHEKPTKYLEIIHSKKPYNRLSHLW